MQVSVTEKVTMDSGAQGGVVNLLRMARAQCGVAVAFAALRNADGTFALATFPPLGADTVWTVEAVDELVHQTWADPHLSGGRVLVRSGRLPGENWPGQNHQIKLAVAPLSDLAAADRPWGLLCVAEPASGQFEQEHLDLLGTMAARLTSYLRARQEVVENVFTVVADERPAPAEESGGAEGFEPSSRILAAAPPAPPPAPPRPVREQAAVHSEALLDVAVSVPVVEWYRGAGAFSPGTPPVPGTPPPAPSEPPAPSVSPAPSEPPAPPAPPLAPSEPPAPAPSTSPPAGSHRPLPVEAVPEAGDVLGTILGLDPLTGLARLPSVLVHLGGALGALRRSGGGCVALVLVDLRSSGPTSEPVPDPLLRAVADRLGDLVRNGDLLGRIGRGTFAVVAEVKTGSGDAAAIERRLVDATRSIAEGTSGVAVRSALTTVGADGILGAEDVLRRAIAQMGAQ